MSKSIIINTTPCLFATEIYNKGKRALVIQGLHSGPRQDLQTQNLRYVILDEQEVEELKNKLHVVNEDCSSVHSKECRSVSMNRCELLYSNNKLLLSSPQEPGKSKITLHSLMKKDNFEIDQKWFLKGFIKRFSDLLESFIAKEDITPHGLKETITGGLIKLYYNNLDSLGYQHPNRLFHVTMEAADGMSYRIISDQGTVNFAVRTTTELDQIRHLVKEINRATSGLNFAGVLNPAPKMMMTAYQSLETTWKVFNNEKVHHFIIVQTSLTVLRRIIFTPTKGTNETFQHTLNRIETDINHRYIIKNDNFLHIEVETGSTPIKRIGS